MKRLSLLAPVIALSLIACTSPSGGEGSASRDSSAGGSTLASSVTSPADGITDSEVFIAGRSISIKPFIMEDHEVTQGEYQAVMGSNPSNKKAGDDYPVESVNWYDVLVYCNKRSMNEGKTPCYTIKDSTNPADWGEVPTTNDSSWNSAICNFNANGYRLPTEAEWEYMARGKNLTNQGQTTYSGSDSLDTVAWYATNSGGKIHQVKQKQANKAGMYDMSGNVWEWCWDCSITESTPASGSASGYSRVKRGGRYYSATSLCTVASRDCCNPYYRNRDLGFRVCRSCL